jgi:hypothetical protein
MSAKRFSAKGIAMAIPMALKNRTNDEVNYNQQNQYQVHHQVNSYVGLILAVELFQTFEH